MPRALYIPIVWFSVALITLVSLGTTAYGHARREVGPYRFVVGFVVEPAYEGLKNGVDLRVLQADTDGPGTTPPASRSGCACAAPCGPRSVPDHQRWDRRHGHGPLRGTHECIAVALALVPALAPVEITTQEEQELTDFLLALSSAYASAWTQKPATLRRTPEP